MDGEEEEWLRAHKKGQTTSGKLRSDDTSAIHKVLWPHELIFTPEGQPATYESLSTMVLVNGFLTIMSLQTDAFRTKIVYPSTRNDG